MLDDLDAVLDRLADADLGDSESVVAVLHGLARFEAIAAGAVGSWDARRGWAADGAKSAAAWLMWRCHVPSATAHRMVRLARALRSLPLAAAAWLAGRITSAQVAALARVRTDRTAELLARDEAMLVSQAETLRYSHFDRVVRYWQQRADAEACDDEAARQVEDRSLDVARTFGGTVVGQFVLDPIQGTIVLETIQAVEDELFRADWAEARDRLGRDPLPHELARTPKQRRADALVEICVRARTAPKDGRRPRPLFSALVGWPEPFDRVCELADGTVVAPAALAPWLVGADIERATIDDDGQVRVGEARRFAPDLERTIFEPPDRKVDDGQGRCFTGATRRAVELLHAECFHRTCELRGGQIDHIEPAAWGGPTIRRNGRRACGFHNRRRGRDP